MCLNFSNTFRFPVECPWFFTLMDTIPIVSRIVFHHKPYVGDRYTYAFTIPRCSMEHLPTKLNHLLTCLCRNIFQHHGSHLGYVWEKSMKMNSDFSFTVHLHCIYQMLGRIHQNEPWLRVGGFTRLFWPIAQAAAVRLQAQMRGWCCLRNSCSCGGVLSTIIGKH